MHIINKSAYWKIYEKQYLKFKFSRSYDENIFLNDIYSHVFVALNTEHELFVSIFLIFK